MMPKLDGGVSARASEWSRRPVMAAVVIFLAVLAVHLVLGLGMILSPHLRSPAGASKPLVLLTELPSAMGASNVAIDLHLKLSLPSPRPSMPISPGVPDTAGVIVDAQPADAAQVMRICGALPMQGGRHDDAASEPTVLVRVDADGRVSDSRLLVGSGSADRDAALQHCLLTLARLTPVELEGRAVAAWQRLNPARVQYSRRP